MIATDRPLRSPGAVVAACGLVVLLEGYDQSVYGAVLPVLVKDASWNLSRANAAYVGRAAFVGMFVGAIVASRLAARASAGAPCFSPASPCSESAGPRAGQLRTAGPWRRCARSPVSVSAECSP